MRFLLILSIILLVLASFVIWPEMDLTVAGWFYAPATGFYWRDAVALNLLQDVAYYGARVLAIALAVVTVITFVRGKNIAGLNSRAWLFLFLGLFIGPGLVANVIFKEHWGRARPREVVEFGGSAPFSPPLVIRHNCDSNCSFVSGDAAFGFYFPSIAYVVVPKRSRRVFWSGMALGSLFGAARILMGAHFLSDVLFAAFFMLLTTALLHAAMFGRAKTAECWRRWGFRF